MSTQTPSVLPSSLDTLARDVRENDRLVLVLRGVPGAGKSTLAAWLRTYAQRETKSRVDVFSADQFFTDAHGNYRFDVTKLSEAHSSCTRRFVGRTGLLTNGLVIVDNTATSNEEAAPYMAVGHAFGWRTRLVTVEADTRAAARRNVHGVPDLAVGGMASRLAESQGRVPPFWGTLSVPAADMDALVAGIAGGAL
jgi:adenylylsulfate kinase-like enzyme